MSSLMALSSPRNNLGEWGETKDLAGPETDKEKKIINTCIMFSLCVLCFLFVDVQILRLDMTQIP